MYTYIYNWAPSQRTGPCGMTRTHESGRPVKAKEMLIFIYIYAYMHITGPCGTTQTHASGSLAKEKKEKERKCWYIHMYVCICMHITKHRRLCLAKRLGHTRPVALRRRRRRKCWYIYMYVCTRIYITEHHHSGLRLAERLGNTRPVALRTTSIC